MDTMHFIQEYKGYRIFIDEKCNPTIWYKGRVKHQPFMEGPPELTVAIQTLVDDYAGTPLTDKILEAFTNDLSHYLSDVSRIEMNIMINRRLMVLDKIVKDALHSLDDELIAKGIHEERMYD